MSSISPYPEFEVRAKCSILCAIKNNNLDAVRTYLKNGALVNVPVETTEPGYTILHLACMENKLNLVKMLIEEFEADVNVTAGDGSQPLILAGLLGNLSITRILLNSGANVDAEFSHEVHLKFAQDKKWCNDFGDKITLLIFAVVNNDTNLTRILLVHSNVNFKLKTVSGNTLVMFAIEKGYYEIVNLVSNIDDKKFMNTRDADGIPATHYPFFKNQDFKARYDPKKLSLDVEIGLSLRCLVGNGADVFAMIDNNPDTLLINIAAYRGFCETLQYLLPYCRFLTNSKALYNATLPVQNSKQVQIFLSGSYSRVIEKKRKKTVGVILKDLVNRRTFGLFVPEEEKILMDKLIATNVTVKNYVRNYEKKFIHGFLKRNIIESQKITIFDFVMQSVSDKKLRLYVKNKNFSEEFFRICNECFMRNTNILWFIVLYKTRIKIVEERIELLDKLKDVSLLRKFVPLPYELVLGIVDYLSNDDLKEFIDSFIKI